MMDTITLDPATRARLAELGGGVRVCDERGRTLGFFFPAGPGRPEDLEAKLLHAWARSLVSDEELDEAFREPGGRPTAEVLERLEGR